MATHGRGSAKTAKFRAVILNFFAGLQCALAASTYTVGEGAGWGLGNDYSAWTKMHTFAVGDSIVFNYGPPTHSVLQVSEADYQSCNINSPSRSYKSGKDTVTLTDPSSYFICGTPGHCQSGMKLAIVTGSSPSTPYAPPTPSNPTPTTPSNPTLPPPSNPAPPTPSHPTPTTPSNPAPLTPSSPSNPAPPTPSSPLNPAPPAPSHSTPTIPSTPAPPNPSSPSTPAPPTTSNPTPPNPSNPTPPTASNPTPPTPSNPAPPTPSNPTPTTPSNPTSGTPSARTPPSSPNESSSSMLLQSGTSLTLLTLYAVAMPFLL